MINIPESEQNKNILIIIFQPVVYITRAKLNNKYMRKCGEKCSQMLINSLTK